MVVMYNYMIRAIALWYAPLSRALKGTLCDGCYKHNFAPALDSADFALSNRVYDPARHLDCQYCPSCDQDRVTLLRGGPAMGTERLHSRLWRLPAAWRTSGGPLRAPTLFSDRIRTVYRQLPSGWFRP